MRKSQSPDEPEFGVQWLIQPEPTLSCSRVVLSSTPLFRTGRRDSLVGINIRIGWLRGRPEWLGRNWHLMAVAYRSTEAVFFGTCAGSVPRRKPEKRKNEVVPVNTVRGSHSY